MANIKTGADKLVELVSQKAKITVDEAAKTLGVGKDVVQEWAEFLEEEGLVTLDYNLSKTWIKERKITKADVLDSAKEVASEKDAFARRIDAAIGTLEKETVGFEDVRKQFITIQSHIKEEIDTVKKQLSELERYDSLKKNLDNNLVKQKIEYDSVVKDAEEKLRSEAEKYDALKSSIERERRNLDIYSQKIDELKKLRGDYERTIETLKSSLKNIDMVLSDQGKKLGDAQSNMGDFKKSLDSLQKELSTRKESMLNKHISEIKSRQDEFSKQLQSLGQDVHSTTSGIKSYSDVSGKLHNSFDGFFSQTINTDKFITEIEKDKDDLKKELIELKSKVLAFNLMTSNSSVKTEIKDIEEKLRSYDVKRENIKSKVEKLILMIKGNDKS